MASRRWRPFILGGGQRVAGPTEIVGERGFKPWVEQVPAELAVFSFHEHLHRGSRCRRSTGEGNCRIGEICKNPYFTPSPLVWIAVNSRVPAIYTLPPRFYRLALLPRSLAPVAAQRSGRSAFPAAGGATRFSRCVRKAAAFPAFDGWFLCCFPGRVSPNHGNWNREGRERVTAVYLLRPRMLVSGATGGTPPWLCWRGPAVGAARSAACWWQSAVNAVHWTSGRSST